MGVVAVVADMGVGDEDVDLANWKLSRLSLGKRFAQGQHHDLAVIKRRDRMQEDVGV